MSKVNLVLPAAGLGSRFRSVGEIRPKPLIPVFEIPMIMWVLLNFPLEPQDKIYIISQEADDIPHGLGDIPKSLKSQITFLEINGLTQGPAETVSKVFEKLDDEDSLIVANTDQFVFADLAPFIQMVRSGESDGQILTMSASSDAWSYVGRDESGKISRVVEKVQISNEATVGVYGWNKVRKARDSFMDTFERDIRTNNEFYVAPTYNYLIERGAKIEAYEIGKHGEAVHGLGIPSDLNDFLNNPKAILFADKFKQQI
jgi:NDP-sugar pyrophosphorylase family protein